MTRWPNKREAWPFTGWEPRQEPKPDVSAAERYRQLYLKARDERDAALERAERAEARLGELERGIEDALTAEAAKEREALESAIETLVPQNGADKYLRGWDDARLEFLAAIRARGRE